MHPLQPAICYVVHWIWQGNGTTGQHDGRLYIGTQEPHVSELHLWRRDLNRDGCKCSPSIRKEECKTRNIHHSIENQSRYSWRGEGAHVGSHFYRRKTFGKWPGRTYLGRSERWPGLKGRSLIHKFKNLLSWQRRGSKGSIVTGSTKWGEPTSPTLPQSASTPAETQSAVMWEIKFWNCSQIVALPRWLGGGRGASYGEPRKFPLKGSKKCSTWTSFRIVRIRSTEEEPWSCKICPHTNEWLWISPALKSWDCGNEVDPKMLGWDKPQPYQEKEGSQRRGRSHGLYHTKEHIS